MNEIDGGPAFPLAAHPGMSGRGPCAGMTLRDYFAGQALAMMAPVWLADERDYVYVAKKCYGVADAMLAERDKAR